ncbi:unnamed protein product [Gulo gulo]|uniref:Uncharacterized protein n=1 Tax=Gulo gulo TaxID=48420 RepID=A0A9X9LSY8_GULGU|nr:unnamed protein product [Gulo gulo]
MLLEAQHSAWLTSVFSTRLHVASRPCCSQHTPPVHRRAVTATPGVVPSCSTPNTQLPALGAACSWCSVTTEG